MNKIFCLRSHVSGYQTLVEFQNESQMNKAVMRTSQITRAAAEKWVRDGKEHETGYWIDDDGVLQYAEAEPQEEISPEPAPAGLDAEAFLRNWFGEDWDYIQNRDEWRDHFRKVVKATSEGWKLV
jgi:hypothetical protein